MAQNLEQKLSNVLSRHPNVNINSLMHNESLGFKPDDKKAVEDHEQAGGNKNEKFAKLLVTKGPHTIKELQSLANDHSAKGMKDFATDMAKEFGL